MENSLLGSFKGPTEYKNNKLIISRLDRIPPGKKRKETQTREFVFVRSIRSSEGEKHSRKPIGG